MKTISKFLMFILGLILISLLLYGGFISKRKINYNFSYKAMVEDTIKEYVKEECLKK